jgi:hypothetical protein
MEGLPPSAEKALPGEQTPGPSPQTPLPDCPWPIRRKHRRALHRVEGAVDVEELCGEAALALVGPVERNGRLTALCQTPGPSPQTPLPDCPWPIRRKHRRALHRGGQPRPVGRQSPGLGREFVLRGERGGVEVDHTLVLARVEGAVDVEDTYFS